MKTYPLALAACIGVACSGASTTSDTSAAFTTGVWASSLPANVTSTTLGATVQARDCEYTIGTAVASPPYPPQYLAFVQRSGHEPHCTAAYMVIGSSYAQPSVAIASGHGGLVADYTSKATPSGEAHTALFIVELDEKTGDVIKTASLAAMSPDFYHPQQGNVWNGALEIGPGGTLTVTGDKDGIIPGELGTGWHYIATYDKFLHRSDTPAPTSVVVFNAL